MVTPIKPLPNIRKIAVLRANALGDFIFALPALAALRRTYPKAEITYLGKQWHAQFIPGRVKTVDRAVVIPPCAGVGEPEDYTNDEYLLNRFFASMRVEHFDIALQLHGGGRYSNPFVNRLGASLTIGSRSNDAKPLDIAVRFMFYQNEVLRYLEIANLAGAATSEIAPHLAPTHQDNIEARALTGDTPYAIIHPGATDPRRRWPANNFIATARRLAAKGLRVYITGTGDESSLTQSIANNSEGAIDVCNRLSLGGLTGLLANAYVMVSNDSGPLHLARAVGCPTVGLYWCGNYITAGPIKLARNQSLISWTVNCPQCGTPCTQTVPFGEQACRHPVSFIQDIRTEDVLKAIDIVLR